MTKKTAEGVTITILVSGTNVPHDAYSNRVAYRGELVTLTAEQVEETKDRDGRSWLDLSDEDQLSRWGVVRFRRGDHTSEVDRLGDDDAEGYEFRRWEREREDAKAISDPGERAKALAEVRRRYPERVASSKTIRTY